MGDATSQTKSNIKSRGSSHVKQLSSKTSSRGAIFIETGLYKDSQVAIKRIGSVIYFNRQLLIELRNVG